MGRRCSEQVGDSGYNRQMLNEYAFQTLFPKENTVACPKCEGAEAQKFSEARDRIAAGKRVMSESRRRKLLGATESGRAILRREDAEKAK